ncbi:hypothetical protein D3C86_2132420 [compost metagenome]
MPPGGVQVPALPYSCTVTSMLLALLVVTLGAICVVALFVAAPASFAMGVTKSTPLNEVMPPTTPTCVPPDKAHA